MKKAKSSIKIVTIYIIVSLTWILFSDKAEEMITSNIKLLTKISILKGYVFVLLTAYMLFLLIESERKKREKIEELWKFYATYDFMTKAYNRRSGLKILEEEFNSSKEKSIPLTIGFIDINDLKYVNDNFGHSEGDRLIKNVFNVFKENISENDSIVRLGGDEFLIILPECSSENAQNIWVRIDKTIKEINNKNSFAYSISVSVGFVTSDEEFKTIDDFLVEADKRMYENKKVIKKSTNR